MYDLTESIADLEKEMFTAAEALDFERAAELRDRIKALKDSPTLFSVPAGQPGKNDNNNAANKGRGRENG